MDIVEKIRICSGFAGVTEFERLQTQDFIAWFEDNIRWNSQETQELGRSVIAELRAS